MALNLRAPQSERYATEADYEPDGGRPLGAAMSDWDREAASRNPAGMAEELEQPSSGWRRWIRGGFGILALAGFLGVLWYAYEWGLGGGESVELPTVTAETGPEKEKPSDPGGLQVPYQDQLVLNQDEAEATAPRVERLLPPPEAPLPPPSLTEIAPSFDEMPDALPLEGETGMAVGEADTLQPASEPTVPEAAPEAAAEAQAAETVPEVPAAPSAQAATDSQPQASETQASETQASEAQAAETQAAASQSTETQSAATQAAAATGDFAVQLVSLKDQGAAEKEWSRLQGVFPKLLGDKSLLLQSAEVAGVGKVYRLRAGPFATRATAAKVCAQLKSKQQDCLVVNR